MMDKSIPRDIWFLRFSACIITFTALAWFYLSSVPSPPAVGNNWKYSLVIATNQLIHYVASHLGGDEFVQKAHSYLHFILSCEGLTNIKILNSEFQGIPVRIYEPYSNGYDRPGIIFLPSIGYTHNSPNAYDGLATRLSRDLDAVVVSVQHLAVKEYNINDAFNNAKLAALFFFDNSELWDVNRDKIGVAGDGTGGGLALSLSILLRDGGSNPQFAFSGLLSPHIQGIDFRLPSYKDMLAFEYDFSHRNTVVHTLAKHFDSRKYYDAILNNSHISQNTYEEYQEHVNRQYLWEYGINADLDIFFSEKPVCEKLEMDLLDPYNMPLMADSFLDLPPVFLMTSQASSFRDEGLILAKRLDNEGQLTDHFHSDTGWQGMFMFVDGRLDIEEAGDITDKLTEFAAAFV